MSVEWHRYRNDPVAEKTGITFDRTPAGELIAPEGVFRVYAYHVDWDEAPVCYCDVPTVAAGKKLCDNLSQQKGGFNVDYAVVYDQHGECVHNGCPW